MDPNSIEDKKKAAYYMRNNPARNSSGSSGGSNNGWVSFGQAIIFIFVVYVVISVLSGK